ncbi:hypothetical protein RRG50_04505 [Mycoplasmopsis felis]|uniref:hypothetical protein n=1 Tax=Mycoplasmopsis felis TaxID=33923 RepID=UPI002AFDDD96|nr:hypothetical protein [Mycoplasmopsis felis]WQQ11080.1 hypothetical protein RRG45_01015 [Mycoplasmopsis felis]
MENKSELLAKFKDLLDDISSKQLNKDQKELAYEILSTRVSHLCIKKQTKYSKF